MAEPMNANREAYDNLCYYTLGHSDPSFIHQHVVDAFAAQDSSDDDKPIRLNFALVGLYLHVEKGFSGKEVQFAHMKLGRKKQQWPSFRPPKVRGAINAAIVLAAPPGDRDKLIYAWCKSVWRAFSDSRDQIEMLLAENGITDTRSVMPRKS